MDEWTPIGPHGGRLQHQVRTDEHGLRYQVAAPWRKEGCKERADISLAWMKVLVWRRDGGTCQVCGAHGKEARMEVQHIVPLVDLAADGDSAAYLRVAPGGIGACGHNLVLLCRTCHLKTNRHGYAGVPGLSLGKQQMLEAFP